MSSGFTLSRSRYQISVYRTNGPLVYTYYAFDLEIRRAKII